MADSVGTRGTQLVIQKSRKNKSLNVGSITLKRIEQLMS